MKLVSIVVLLLVLMVSGCFDIGYKSDISLKIGGDRFDDYESSQLPQEEQVIFVVHDIPKATRPVNPRPTPKKSGGSKFASFNGGK
jgi:hypothetical protein